MRWITGPLSSPTNGSTSGPDWPRASLVRLTVASCWLRQHAASQVVDLVCGASTGPSNAAVSATYHSIVRVRCGRRASPSCLSLCCPLLPSAVLCCPLSVRPVSSHGNENGHSRLQPRSLPTTPRPEWGCGGQQQSRLSLLGPLDTTRCLDPRPNRSAV
jgi:hypothetical protein